MKRVPCTSNKLEKRVADGIPEGSSVPEAIRPLAVPRTALRQLAACAHSDRLCPELGLLDRAAKSLFANLAGIPTSFSRAELRCSAFRASLIDELARCFFARNPGAGGTSLWPMLGTRSHRLREYAWIDLDAPPLAALRQRYLPPRRGWTQGVSCLCGGARGLTAGDGVAGPRLFVLDESVLPLRSKTLEHLLDSLCAGAPAGSELLLCLDAPARLGPGLHAGVVELARDDGAVRVRYPRLRRFASLDYSADLRSSIQGLNAVAELQGGPAPALVHLLLC